MVTCEAATEPVAKKHTQLLWSSASDALGWIRDSSEYLLGMSLVLAQLALGGRAVSVD